MSDGLTPPQIFGAHPRRWMAWLALAVGIALSLFGWNETADHSRRLAESRFQARVHELQHALQGALAANVQALRGAQAYVGGAGEPGRAQFSRLYSTLRVADSFPGISVFAYLSVLAPGERAAFERRWRAEYDAFRIRPDGERGEYAVVTAVEPQSELNLRAIGSDSLASAQRREAIEAARDSGEVRITSKLNLVMDDPRQALPAFLMYQAIYRGGALPATSEVRRAQIIGYIIGAVRVDTLVASTFGKTPSDIAIHIHDGSDANDNATLYYASHPEHDMRRSRLSQQHAIGIGGRSWQVEFGSLPAFENEVGNTNTALRLLAGGILVSVLLFAIIWSLAQTQERAEALAGRMTRALRENEGKLRALFEQAPIGIWLLDLDGRIVDCNEQFACYIGAERERILGFSMLTEARDTALNEPIRRAIAGESVRHEGSYTSTIGKRSSIYSWHFQPVDIDGEPSFVLCFVEDISARKQAEADVEHLAQHDSLTGLANRSLLRDRLQQAIAGAPRSGRQLALLFIDLDFFKHINDTLGHSAGDAMLVEIAARLRQCVRSSDTLARIGGDEFVILLTNVDGMDDCARVADKVIASIAEPISIDGQTFNSTASIGIAAWPADGTDSETLTRNADVAMYHAKRSGRNNYQFFTVDMNAKVRAMAVLERGLRDALADDQFRLHYQAQVDGSDGRIIGVETLLRWQHPTMGLLSPAMFIELAEERGLINPIGDWVLFTACREAKKWMEAGHDRLPVSVNISPVQMRKGRLRDSVAQALRESGLPPPLLTLEITEGAVMEDIDAAARLLGELHEIGVQIEIDDFGTGHSSLAYLKKLPIQRLKIDRSFVRDIPGDPDDAAIVDAIIGLARSLKLDIIAEGVETDEQCAFLLARGCRAMQGFRFARPVPVEEFLARLTADGHPARIPAHGPGEV